MAVVNKGLVPLAPFIIILFFLLVLTATEHQ